MSAPHLKPAVILPVDEGLPGLGLLFNGEWVWEEFCTQFGEPEEVPHRIRPRHLSYRPGTRALVSYMAEWKRGRWLEEDQFAVELVAGKSERLFRYPDDPYLPGLQSAALAVDAHQLLSKYVPISPHRLRVEVLRYHPTIRAVLRYTASWRQARVGKITLFVRVMPPVRLSRLLSAAELAGGSGFALPRLVGCWPEGGVVWMSRVPGDTVRTLIRNGTPPEPEQIITALAKLWATPLRPENGQPLDLLGSFQKTKGLLAHLLQGEEAHRLLQQVTDALGPFSEAWRPSALAHNDFYDDQILLTPEGHLALVDFEETGPGDPLLDVGNMLAHLRWMTRFGIAPEACDSYRRRFRTATLERFDWSPQALNLREALALFRLSSNPFRQLQHNWPTKVETGLALAAEALEGKP
jgi:hypothetical protein